MRLLVEGARRLHRRSRGVAVVIPIVVVTVRVVAPSAPASALCAASESSAAHFAARGGAGGGLEGRRRLESQGLGVTKVTRFSKFCHRVTESLETKSLNLVTLYLGRFGRVEGGGRCGGGRVERYLRRVLRGPRLSLLQDTGSRWSEVRIVAL